jgi:hypothetical protein
MHIEQSNHDLTNPTLLAERIRNTPSATAGQSERSRYPRRYPMPEGYNERTDCDNDKDEAVVARAFGHVRLPVRPDQTLPWYY